MPLIPKDEKHKKQIEAGIKGRKKGHRFEEILCEIINSLKNVDLELRRIKHNVLIGNPGEILIQYILQTESFNQEIKKLEAFWLGGLATSGKGDIVRDKYGNKVGKSKSDILLNFYFSNNSKKKIGVSVKSCNTKTPTNDQLFFTTARAFCNLLRTNSIQITENAENALRMFCGDNSYRPQDTLSKENLEHRLENHLNPDRWFWEELPREGKNELEQVFRNNQNEITNLLLREAYPNDPFPPEYLIHQTVKYEDFNNVTVAIFTIYELIQFSYHFTKFETKKYKIYKGTYKDDDNEHLAPRFGFIQFQRGGQRQHPTQLQFNLKAGYFNHLPKIKIENKKNKILVKKRGKNILDFAKD